MKKVLLVCNDGMSTGFLTNKMNDLAKKMGMDCQVRAISEMTLDREWEDSDCILLGPQIGYLRDGVEKRIQGKRPVEAISPVDYGRVNAENVLKQAQRMMGE